MTNASRMRDSWGSISYDKRRKVGRIRYWAETEDGYRRCSKTVRGTRRDVEEARAALMLDHGGDAPCPTVGTVWKRYAVPDMERRVDDGDMSPSTLRMYGQWWQKHVDERWGDMPCDQVRPLLVQQWLSGIGLSAAKNAMPLLRKVMDYAVRYEWVESNPMNERYIMPSKTTVRRRDAGTWGLSELEGLWKKVHLTWMEPAFLVAAFGGTRVGESLGPLAEDVALRDVDGIPVALVSISRQIPHKGEPTTSLKNNQSRRTIAIAGRAASRLAEIASSIDQSWFLTNDGTGAFVRQDRYYDNWRKMGMEHPFRNLRNSWQTWMRWEMKVAPYYIEPMMGHVINDVTGRYYDRPQADVFSQVMADAYRENRYDADWRWLDSD